MIDLRWSVAAALVCAGAAAAQDRAQPADLCVEKAASAAIHVMVCRSVPDDETLAALGRAVCDGDLACGVWFWADAAAAPDTAPDNHDGLTDAQVRSALGVYAAEQDMLIRIGRDGG